MEREGQLAFAFNSSSNPLVLIGAAASVGCHDLRRQNRPPGELLRVKWKLSATAQRVKPGNLCHCEKETHQSDHHRLISSS